MKHFNYKWTWWSYNDSSFIQGEIKQRHGELVHFESPLMNWVNEIDPFFVVVILVIKNKKLYNWSGKEYQGILDYLGTSHHQTKDRWSIILSNKVLKLWHCEELILKKIDFYWK